MSSSEFDVMNIVILSQYLRNIENFGSNNSRFVYLAKLLANDEKNEVEIITSDFNHAEKKHFTVVGEINKVRVSMVHEPGYLKNISLKRFISHKKLAQNVKKYLQSRTKPDICYCAVPSLDVAAVVAKFCKDNNVRFVVDIQDLWPEAFKMVFRVPLLNDIVFAPMKIKADKIYNAADSIVAVSRTYAERALKVNNKVSEAIVVYLGTEKKYFDGKSCDELSHSEKITIVYVGSMSASYDLISVIEAISMIGDKNVKLLAMGDGNRKEFFEEYAKRKGINAEFTGALPYPQMVKRLLLCDIAVNPICKGSAGSIINKVGDYAMAGLPVVNSQECSEYRDLLERNNAGINCECENPKDMASALKRLICDSKLREIISMNSKRLGINYFARENSYIEIVDKVFNGLN